VERWDGTTWAVQTTPALPAGAHGASLSGVSCTATTACTAVGGYLDSGGNSHTLAERWNGSAWAIQTTPTPSGTGSTLAGVSCSSSTACTAVGSFYPPGSLGNSLGQNGLVERWNGTAWTIQTSPNPTNGGQGRELDGVSCASATACAASGHDFDGNTEIFTTLTELWDGATWTAQPVSPFDEAGFYNNLAGVSCTTSTACTAVGDGSDIYTHKPRAERWNGTSWATQTTPNLPSGTGQLYGVSCSSSTTCIAVGTQ
jgi:hypothetical protein